MQERKVILTTQQVGMGFGKDQVHPNYPKNLDSTLYDTRETFKNISKSHRIPQNRWFKI